ncbi:MAG: leucine-rich repeat protein [Bacteroidales bacterium]|nr:leucine-rich repeat protein [Bacteroidales bacterium]
MKKLRFLILLTFAATLLAGTEACKKEEETTPKNPSWNVEPGKELPEQPSELGNDVQPPQGAVSVAEAVQYVNSVTTASTDATDIVLKGTCSESEIKELAQSISKGKSAINLDLSNCEVQSINFEGCANLQEVTLPVNVQIPDRAFADCPNLKVVYIGNDEEDNSQSLSKSFFDELIEDPWDFINPYIANFRANVGKEAFLNDWMLEEIYVKSASCKVIGERAFKGCRKLQIAQLGHICVIEEEAFSGCESLAGIAIPSTVSRLAASAFENCPKLTKGKVHFQSKSEWYATDDKKVWLEYDIAEAGRASDVSNFDFQLHYLEDPIAVKPIQYLFHVKTHRNPQAKSIDLLYDDGLVNFVFDWEYSNDELFDLRSKLQNHPNLKITVYANWKYCPVQFAGLSNLIYVEMPYAERIPTEAFNKCVNLKKVVAPKVVKVGKNAFADCSNDLQLSVGWDHNGNGAWFETISLEGWQNMSGGVELEKTPLRFGYDKYYYWTRVDAYNNITCTCTDLPAKIADLKNGRKYNIKVTGFFNDNFDFQQALSNRNDDNLQLYFDFTEVTGMTTVPNRFCWYGRNIVYGAKLPADVKEIGQDAFTNCKKLKTFELPSSVEKIGMIAFTGCGLESDLVLPSTLTEIGQGAFLNAFTGNAKPVFSNVSEDGINQDGKMWYAKDANTDAEIKYDQWKNTEWWDVQSYSFYTKKSYAPVTGDGYVDLGLPSGTLWATCNVGAPNPWDYGDYFAWGEVTPKEVYIWDTYTAGDAPSTLDAAHDAATVNMGSNWRMPTSAEFQELLDNCEWEWTSDYNGKGVSGYIVWDTYFHKTHIFLPAAGYRSRSDHRSAGCGYYRSSSVRDSGNDWCLGFDSGSRVMDYYSRDCGHSVRAVRCR